MLGLTQEQKAKIEQIMKTQLEETAWNFYHERQHVENLFYSRFNFFLVLYGMFVAAIVSLECDSKKPFEVGLLMFAIVILSLVWATLCRNYQTLRMVLCILDKGLPAYHSSPILSKYMKENSKIWRSGDLMAKWIPACCLISLYIYLWYIYDVSDVLIPDLFEIIGGILIFVLLFYDIMHVYKVSACDCDNYLEKQIVESKEINEELSAYKIRKNRTLIL